MPVVGGTARLLRVAGVSVPVEPARALLVLVRAVHAPPPSSARTEPRRLTPYFKTVSRLAAALAASDGDRGHEHLIETCGFLRNRAGIRPSNDGTRSLNRQLLRDAGFPVYEWMSALGRGEAVAARIDMDRVPMLLPRSVWETAVFGRGVDTDQLAAAILDDRRAAFLYAGLHSLDKETLDFLARAPSLVTLVHRQCAAPFAAFAESIVIRGGRVVTPGDARAEPLWEAVVGASPASPERFVAALLQRDEGRLAWLFDSLAHSDTARQAFVLGLALESGEARLAHFRRLCNTFARFQRREWLISARPFSRAPVDPAFMVQQIAATLDGRMAPPRSRRLWASVFGVSPGEPTPADPEDDVQAAWLLEQLTSGSVANRRARLNAVLFAQRLATGAGGAALHEASAVETLRACLTAFPAHQMLMAALERFGLVDTADYVSAVRLAAAITAVGDARGSSLRLAILQGALALVIRAADRGTLDPSAAHRLARTLFALPPNPATFGAAVARWLESDLIAALPPPSPASAAGNLERRLLDGLAGIPATGAAPLVDWEEYRYRVDPTEADRTLLQRIRTKQGGLSVDRALSAARLVRAIADTRGSPAEVASASSTLVAAIPALSPLGGQLFGFDVTDLLDRMLASAVEMRDGRGQSSPAAGAARLHDGLAVVLADVLSSLAYAISIGDPDSAVLLAENPARRHDFAVGASLEYGGPWSASVSVRIGGVTAVRGSLLGLEGALGMTWLRPTTLALPPRVPTVDQGDVRGLGESVAAMNPSRLSDRGRDWIAGALRRGRERTAAHSDDAAALDRLLAEVGVEQWRRRMAGLAAPRGAEAVLDYLSLGEVLVLGADGDMPSDVRAWGLSQRSVDGSLRLALPPRLRWYEMSGRVGVGLLPACVPDLQLRVVELLADAGLPAALAPGVMAYAAWDLMRTAQVAGPNDWLPLMRTAQALAAGRMGDYVAALTHDGPMVPVTQGGASRR